MKLRKAKSAKQAHALSLIEQECIEALRPAEERMNAALLEQTRHLSTFATRKTLAQWQCVELIDWIQENVELLGGSPCLEPVVFEPLVQEMTVKLEGAVAALDPEARMRDEDDEGFSSELDDLHFDDEDAKESSFDDSCFQDNPAEQAQRDRQSALDKVLRGFSINDLFRQLARRLHPDRELDPGLKAQRGQQMQELTEARDQQDVFKLLELYEHHIGESPLSALGDQEAVLELLKAQTARLREEQQEILHRTPLRSHFYQHYHSSNPKRRQQTLKCDREELQHQASEEERITRSITSIATLRPYLEARQDGRHEEELVALQGMFEDIR